MTLKVTTFFQLSTAPLANAYPQRIGGWTESWYHTGTAAQADADWRVQGGFRASMLPASGAVIGARIEDVNPTVGGAVSIDKVFPGDVNNPTDIPQMGLIIKCPAANAANVRRIIMRGIPDDFVKRGEFAPSTAFRNALQLYFDVMGRWSMRGEDLTIPRVPIISIDATGLVTTNGNHGLNQGDIASITRAHFVVGGSLFSGKFRVQPPVTINTYSIGDVTTGAVIKGGFSRKYAIVYPSIDPNLIDIERITTRKVGRPFVPYIGRHKKTA